MVYFFSQAQAQQDHDFIKNTKGFMFFSTPHLGTNVARLNSPTKFLFFPSTEVCELEEDSPQLVDLNQNFVQLGTSIYYVINLRGGMGSSKNKGTSLHDRKFTT